MFSNWGKPDQQTTERPWMVTNEELCQPSVWHDEKRSWKASESRGKCSFCFKLSPWLKWPPSLPRSNDPTCAGDTLIFAVSLGNRPVFRIAHGGAAETEWLGWSRLISHVVSEMCAFWTQHGSESHWFSFKLLICCWFTLRMLTKCNQVTGRIKNGCFVDLWKYRDLNAAGTRKNEAIKLNLDYINKLFKFQVNKLLSTLTYILMHLIFDWLKFKTEYYTIQNYRIKLVTGTLEWYFRPLTVWQIIIILTSTEKLKLLVRIQQHADILILISSFYVLNKFKGL